VKSLRWVIALSLAFAIGMAEALVPIPPLKARVTDLTATLSHGQQQQLEETLNAFEQRKGSQIAVLLVPTTEPEAIEQYAIRVVDEWKLGRKEVDDGILFLIAKEDRAMRIEVGYGLEGVIPDAVAKRIISEIVTPYFRQGDFYGGIGAGIERLIRLIDGEPLPPPDHRDPSWTGIEQYLPIFLFMIFFLGGTLRAMFGRLVGASLAGGLAGGAFWLAVGSLFAALAVGLIAFLFVLGDRGFHRGYGGWTGPGPGGWGGGIGRGGYGGGDFRGGGGGFGGGGASGRW
jgi:uncharacterized protein